MVGQPQTVLPPVTNRLARDTLNAPVSEDVVYLYRLAAPVIVEGPSDVRGDVDKLPALVVRHGRYAEIVRLRVEVTGHYRGHR